MRFIIVLVGVLFCGPAWTQEWEERHLFDEGNATTTLRILSSTDTELFSPLIQDFIQQNPDVAVEYLVSGTADIDRRFRETPDAFDVAISSAMDLQLKLTNDGYALALEAVKYPAWAQWRQSLFAFTSEPAAIVVNRAAFEGLPIPQSRQELIEVLRDHPDVFRGRIGTYDVRSSGLGYLFATQDARLSETFWRLMEVMGGLGVQLYCCSNEMLDDLTSGAIAVAYNVLGSYAEASMEEEKVLEIILPSDFLTTMMRTAFVSAASRNPRVAERFIRFLISFQSSPENTPRTLPPLLERDAGSNHASISLEPALMAFLDSLKRNKFITEWENALIQN